MRFYPPVILLVFVSMLISGCGGKPPAPSIASLSRQWLDIKTRLPEHGRAVFNTGDLETRITDFTGALDRFFTSPAGSLYQIHRPPIMRLVKAVGENTDRLLAAARTGDGAAVFAVTLEIDAALNQLQSIDTGISDAIQLQYFQLFLFFALLVIIIVLALWLLNRRLEKAVRRERQSLMFSRETVLAQEQERSRLARELHDTVAQDLWRLSFQTDSIGKTEEAEERRILCGEVVKGQQELMKRLRTICDALIPPDFQRRGLPGALRSLCYNFQERTGIECALTVQEGLRLDPLGTEAQLQCFRVVQECLANIEKHAQAREAAVLVCNSAPGEPGGGALRGETPQGEASGAAVLRITVSDSGRGFAVPDGDSRLRLRTAGHFGLWTMYERAASLHGTLVIDSEAGEGTHITLEIPLVQKDSTSLP